jgi:hypothetical protein
MSLSKLVSIQVFLFILFLTVSSCRKNTETNIDEKKIIENNEIVKYKFLDTSNIHDYSILNVISDIRKLDSNYNFIKNLLLIMDIQFGKKLSVMNNSLVTSKFKI